MTKASLPLPTDGLCALIESAPETAEAVVTPLRRATWEQLRSDCESLTREYRKYAGRRIGLRFVPTVSSFAFLFAMEALGADLVLMYGRLSDEQSADLARSLGLAAVFCPEPEPARTFTVERFESEKNGSGQATVTILTSGSTGTPKPVLHTWQSLRRPVRRSAHPGQRWLLTYRPNLYAGLQVLLQCMADHGTLYVPGEAAEPAEIARFIADNRVEGISATPSYWRRILLFSDPLVLTSAQPAQITMGGEVVDQAILDALRKTFPHARVVHIYATSELGRCFSVTDGLEGFPARFLNTPSPDGVEMRIVDDELVVRSANSMVNADEQRDWIHTGDLVAIRGDRVVFKGRKSEMINVGGNKVHPIEVERVIRSVPGIQDVRVFATRSSLAGQLVSCELVATQADARAELVQSVQRACAVQLAPYQRPRIVKIVDHIDLSPANKVIRR